MADRKKKNQLQGRKVSDIKDLLSRAYKLGSEVGYANHDEFVGWVAEDKEDIFTLAEALDVLDEAKSAYGQGKSYGKNKSLSDMTSTLYEYEEKEEDRRRRLADEKEIREAEEKRAIKNVAPTEEAKKEEWGVSFLHRSEFLEMPKKLDGYKALKKKGIFEVDW